MTIIHSLWLRKTEEKNNDFLKNIFFKKITTESTYLVKEAEDLLCLYQFFHDFV
jgi:hypothetical protein